MEQYNKTPLQLFISFLYFFAVSMVSIAIIYALFFVVTETIKIYQQGQISLLEMELRAKTLAAELLHAKQIPVTATVTNDWTTWLKPVFISVSTLSIRYFIGLFCTLIPKAFFGITYLGPLLQLIALGPESFIAEQLTPAEIKNRLDELTAAGLGLSQNMEIRAQASAASFGAIACAVEEMQQRLRLLEGNTPPQSLVSSAPTLAQVLSNVGDNLPSDTSNGGHRVTVSSNTTSGIFDS